MAADDDTSVNFRRHRIFYLVDVTFEVEGCLFKVPRRNLEDKSEIFRDMFSVPAPEDGKAEGTNDDNPIRLEGIKQDDFYQLLRVVYHTGPPSYNLSVAEWISVLKLASMWMFKDVRHLCIAELSKLKMDDMDKLMLARTYEVKEWLAPTLRALVSRRKPMCSEDVDRLGLDWVLKIAALREISSSVAHKCQSCNNNNPICQSCCSSVFTGGNQGGKEADLTEKIEDTFDI